jgi:hypothetical protein
MLHRSNYKAVTACRQGESSFGAAIYASFTNPQG